MARMVEGSVENGWLANVDFPFHKGNAGAQQGAAGIRLAFFGTLVRDMVGAAGTVDGKPATVTEAAKSDTTRGMVTFVAVLD
jgi:hypothetical protein